MWSPTIERSFERYQLTCRHCGHRWQLDYSVRRHLEPDGETEEVYFLSGLPATSPWAGRRCPRCSYPRVDVRMIRRRSVPAEATG